MSTKPLIRITDLNFAYGTRPILQGVDLDIPRGKVTAIMGASGGGKTTVLRLISGQSTPPQNSVYFDGIDIGSLSHKELFAVRKRMGMLFQFGALFTDMTVFENVAFPLRENTQLSEELLKDTVLMKLNAVGLRGARDLMPSEISGGMARRVALARAIAMDPELVLYDEPFAGLDPIALATTSRLIRNLNDALGITSVLVSHDLDVTFAMADHVVVLANGSIAEQGTPEQVRNSTNPLVHQFVHAEFDGPVRFHYPGPSLEDDFDSQRFHTKEHA